MKRRVQVQVEHLRPGGIVGVGDRAGGESTDQVNENVDPAELLRDGVCQGFCGSETRDLGREGMEVRTLELVLRDLTRGAGDRGSGIEKRFGNGSAQPTVGAGDKNDFVFHADPPTKSLIRTAPAAKDSDRLRIHSFPETLCQVAKSNYNENCLHSDHENPYVVSRNLFTR